MLPDMVGGNAYSEAMLTAGADGTPGSDARDAGGSKEESPPHASGHPAAKATVASDAFYGALPPRELYARWCAANALLPAVQFSIAPWQYDEEIAAACRKLLELRKARLPLLEALAEHAVATGEPLVRPLWWHDPFDATCQWIDDQFLLGNSTMVAPVLEAAVSSRSVYIPSGRWRDGRSGVHEGPKWLTDYAVPLEEVAIFELLSADTSSIHH